MKIGIVIFIIVIGVLGIITYSTFKPDAIELQGVEVQDYQGERLDSVNDFRENSIKGPQYIDIEDYDLEIFGLVDNTKVLSYDDVLDKQAYEKVVQLNCVEGWSAKILWKGVLVRDVLDEVNISDYANTIIFYAYDGYSTAFPLDYFYNNDIILAYEMNGVTLPAERGFPFQLVAEDRWGYKWIKWITDIEISSNESYEGFWESRGYSNTGNLNESFFK
ncbi:molybdopterin-dependent oxidoreductase [Candidatus Pacearchaeota archaeon]|nr:molybdopterin-dependent oxidoreductase [Candidatus Pacearchaeota archaeon]